MFPEHAVTRMARREPEAFREGGLALRAEDEDEKRERRRKRHGTRIVSGPRGIPNREPEDGGGSRAGLGLYWPP